MRIHFISIGGSIMHNLAIALKLKGHDVSGSDDEIFEPAKTRLKENGILPDKIGWNAGRISKDIDAIILGMHARTDNPELSHAQKLKLNIYSFPEYIYLNAKEKTRIAIAGSHGKTTITSMVMHVMRKCNFDFDYMVGALVKGFDQGLKLTEEAPFIVLEADEYLSSPINMEPKFLWYKPQIVLLSGIAWDHMNVFPSIEVYHEQFRKFIKSLPKNAVVVYYNGDKILSQLVNEFNHIDKIPYQMPSYRIEGNQFVVEVEKNEDVKLELFGSHNVLNTEGAKHICCQIGISNSDFYEAIQDFKGAGKRLETIFENDNFIAFRDFAHAPSKVKATIDGMKDQYPNRTLIGCLELHTFSSLNAEFIPQYKNSMQKADYKFVYINQEAVELKRMKLLTKAEVFDAFGDPDLQVFYDREELVNAVQIHPMLDSVLLMMSSGNFGGLNLDKFAKQMVKK